MLDCTVVSDLMSQYIDDEIDDASLRAEFEAHIAFCADCKETLASLQSLMAELHDLPELELPHNFHESAMERIYALPEANSNNGRKVVALPKPRKRNWLYAYASAAAGVCITILGLGVLASFSPKVDFTGMQAAEAVPFSDAYVATPYEAHDDIGFVDIGKSETGKEKISMEIQSINADLVAVEMPAFESSGRTFTSTDAASENKVIQEYALTIEVENFDTAVAAIKGFAGTTIESNFETIGAGRSDNTRRTGYITKTIPAAQFDMAMVTFSALGEVDSEGRSQYAVAYDMADLSARLAAKEDEYNRLMVMLEKTTNTTDMLAVDDRLQTVINEMESYRGLLAGHTSGVANSVFTIHLTEKPVTQIQPIDGSSFGTNLANTFAVSLNGTIGFLQNTLVTFSGLLLPLLLLGLIVGSIVMIFRKKSKR